MQEHDEPDDSDLQPVRPEDFLARSPYPADARRIGADRWSDDAALIALAASLDPAKLSHKIVAWVLLLAITLPLATNLWWELT